VSENPPIEQDTAGCEKCRKTFTKDYKWHGYGEKYARLCRDCFEELLLDDFLAWHDIFQNEYCDRREGCCDDCPFFFKKGCMMIILHDLIGDIFHLKEFELNRLQQKNKEAVAEWEKELKEAINKVR